MALVIHKKAFSMNYPAAITGIKKMSYLAIIYTPRSGE